MDKEDVAVAILRGHLRKLESNIWDVLYGWKAYELTPEQTNARVSLLLEEKTQIVESIDILLQHNRESK